MNQKKLTQAEREQIYLLKRSGQTIPQIALALGTSLACVRKWWRRGRDEGMLGLLERKRGRPTRGALSEFSPQIQQTCLKLKREHKRWGANRVLIELRNDPALSGLIFPSRSRLYAFFHQECPECLSIWTQHKEVLPTPTATAVHEEWQVDHQEGHRLLDGSIATVCNIRDPYGAAMIASQAFSVKTVQRWRKLTLEEVRQVLRAEFAFSGILTVNVIVEAFRSGFNTEQARAFSSELIEVIDLFLLGTVLFMTSVGLYELFVDPQIPIPSWLSVANLDQLKFNLIAVIIVMLMVLFLGGAAKTIDFENGLQLLYYGGSIALVILAGSVAVLIFQRVHQHEVGHAHIPAHNKVVDELNKN